MAIDNPRIGACGSAATVELGLLGGFELRRLDGPFLVLPTRKAEMLLAYLALPAGYAHSRDKLAALLWGDRQDAQARASLRNAIAALRAVLGTEAIRGERDMVELKQLHISTDIDRLADSLHRNKGELVGNYVKLAKQDSKEIYRLAL